MESTSRDEHELTVTVMRLGRPTLYGSPVVQYSDQAVAHDVTRLPDLPHVQAGELLLLPQKFGDIHLGETLCCYVCVYNGGQRPVSAVTVSLDLQTSCQRLALKTSGGALPADASLSPAASCGRVITHEVKELGSHLLICNVGYVDDGGHTRSLFKRFRFESQKPLDVKTKFYSSSSDCVYLEAQIQNITRAAIFMERVVMEPSSVFSAVDVRLHDDDLGQRTLAPLDSRLFLFCVQARDCVAADWRKLAASTDVGKLDISWRSALGQRGRIQTSQLHRAAPSSTSSSLAELQVHVVDSPGVVRCLQRFSVGCRVHNTSARAVQLWLRVSSAAASIAASTDTGDSVPVTQQPLEPTTTMETGAGLVWRGVSDCHVADVAAGSMAVFSVSLEARCVGLHALSGVTLIDKLTNKSYDFNNLTQVMVTD